MYFFGLYKIEKPSEARYEKPFRANLAFTMDETARQLVRLNFFYEVLRGEEVVGRVKIIQYLD